ncbi:1,4-dihydroxy-6-naphthoate synthase [Alkalicoccus saliphilus]|jgi:1,4-dihydroxy-6-naphthoate synthase|uniref:1,4-dihydroxy-6-naphtoate synthase n=1 Tax=Alkalicoccus saliphilus TaxID=200989 RepID=A0A2T4U9H8_9BACI|nr:1,4-dihydroxy-6-naphthoate synthase [Alkalicoccus saliphilus]PTL40052.1 1,4-dihydroxy-6-naphthoate synthase [Alkalicoccus saliphilus]
MKIAFSPCPNDTFIFHGLVHDSVPGAEKVEVTYADIDKTNTWAAEQTGPEVMKISYAAFPYAAENYQLIQCGGALGRGCGPLVLTKEAKQPDDLKGKTVAVPSERSTAYMLFRLWQAQKLPEEKAEIIVLPFDEIMPAVQSGSVDAGLVIHEARFTYKNYGLSMLVDLGEWWEEDTGAPIPLGAIIARKGVDSEKLAASIRTSLHQAWETPDNTMDYVMEHAQEMSREVAQSHIDLYVNEYSMALGSQGRYAVETLLRRAAEEGLVPEVEWEKVWNTGNSPEKVQKQ